MSYFSVAEGRVAAEEIPEEDHNIACILGKEESQKHIVRHE